MSLSNAVKSFGTFLNIGDGASPENFTTVAEVTSALGLSMSAKQEDVTNHSSGDPWRQFISTLIDAGTIPLTINFIPTEATHSYSAGLLRDFVNRTRRNFQLVFPDGFNTTWTCPCNIQDFKTQAPIDGVLKADCTLKVAGKPTLA
jgi:predicted secreted protein